jgi:hypothetical protein
LTSDCFGFVRNTLLFQVTNVKAFARQMAAASDGSPSLRQQQQQLPPPQQQHYQAQQQQQYQWQQQQQNQHQQHAPLFPSAQPALAVAGLDAKEIAREREKAMLRQQVSLLWTCVMRAALQCMVV